MAACRICGVRHLHGYVRWIGLGFTVRALGRLWPARDLLCRPCERWWRLFPQRGRAA